MSDDQTYKHDEDIIDADVLSVSAAGEVVPELDDGEEITRIGRPA